MGMFSRMVSKTWVPNMSIIRAWGLSGSCERIVLRGRKVSRRLTERRATMVVWSLTMVERSTGGRSTTWRLGGRVGE